MTRRLFLAALTALAMALTLVVTPASVHASAVTCKRTSIPVNIGVPAQISGTLCVPPGAHTLELLVPGATYTGEPYWDDEGRSYTQLANAEGYATFTMDRLDTGESSQVLPVLVTGTADTITIHQVIRALGFRRNVLVGHSLGSMITALYASRYDDIDAIVLTGMTTYFSQTALTAIATELYPASLDPDPRLRNRPPGEVTISDANRQKLFFEPDVPQSVIDYDNSRKDAFALTELTTVTDETGAITIPTSRITVPVLMVEGDHDVIYACASGQPCQSATEVLQSERHAFAHASKLDAYILAGSGHDLSLSQQYQAQEAAITSWLRHA